MVESNGEPADAVTSLITLRKSLGCSEGLRMRFALDPADTKIDAGSGVLDNSERSSCVWKVHPVLGKLPFPILSLEMPCKNSA